MEFYEGRDARRKAREEDAWAQILSAQHRWEQGEVSRSEYLATKEMLEEHLREANERDTDD